MHYSLKQRYEIRHPQTYFFVPRMAIIHDNLTVYFQDLRRVPLLHSRNLSRLHLLLQNPVQNFELTVRRRILISCHILPSDET